VIGINPTGVAVSENKKILHVLKSEPDDVQKKLMDTLSRNNQSLQVSLVDADDSVYDELIDQIFESDEVITWW
jgi:hypothetical protein